MSNNFKRTDENIKIDRKQKKENDRINCFK